VISESPPPVSVRNGGRILTFWNIVAALIVLGVLVFLAEASRGVGQTLAELRETPVSLDPANLPGYAARTSLRMLAAMVLSLLFTFTYATWAAKSRRAEVLLIPLLDILQSVPILGFLSVTVVFFMSLAPGRVLGAEFAAIFAIFTSQAWNMAFSFFQSLRTVPEELVEASRCFRLSAWMRFWRLEVPFAMPPLVWNMMVSMSGGWFFVVASEAISVGDTTVTLHGVGSYIAVAIEQRDLGAIGWAIGAMLVVILTYDQLLFRPLVAWADRFRFEQETGVAPPRSWALTMLRGSWLGGLLKGLSGLSLRWSFPVAPKLRNPGMNWLEGDQAKRWIDCAWYAAAAVMAAIACWKIASFVSAGVSTSDVKEAILLGLATMLRVRANCPCKRDLGAGGRLDRASAKDRKHRAADSSILGSLPCQPSLSNCSLGYCCAPAQSEHLAKPTHDPGDAVVHPVQRHRGSLHAS
jgi:NitT/TauT family transport system permease protein